MQPPREAWMKDGARAEETNEVGLDGFSPLTAQGAKELQKLCTREMLNIQRKGRLEDG